jgi:multidrug transporter EmrE-like cation transporter
MPLEAPPPEILPVAAAEHAGRAISMTLLLISVSFAVAGQVTLKSAMNRIGRIGSAQVSEAGDTLLRAAKEPLLWVGLIFFGISALFWLVVLSRVPLSVAYPIVGISYILIVLFARIFLNEHVPTVRWLGVIVVALGIAIIGISFSRS